MKAGIFKLALLSVMLPASLISACQGDVGRGAGEKKTGVLEPATQGPPPATKVSSSTYLAEVRSASTMLLCSGPAVLEIMSNFEVRFPEFKLKCQGFDLDLGAMLNAASAASAQASSAQDKSKLIEHDGYVLAVAEIGGAKFEPARPFIIGPIIQDPAKYNGFSRVYQSTVTFKDPVKKVSYNASGSFKVTVINPKTNYQYPAKNINLENVIHWKNEKQGFDGVPSTIGMLFSEMEWYFSYRPILIPVIRIKGQIADFVKPTGAPDQNQQLMKDLVGELTTTLKLERYE